MNLTGTDCVRLKGIGDKARADASADSGTSLCFCGKPLHYSDPRNQALVQMLIDTVGPRLKVTVSGRTWLVPRHYIALHGIKAAELPFLGFDEVRDDN